MKSKKKYTNGYQTMWSIEYLAVGCYLDGFAFGALFTLNFKLPLGTLLLLKAFDSFENHLQFLRNKQMREILRRFNFLAD